MHQVMG